MEKFRRHTKKALVGVIGGLVVLVGLVLIPYPGPGWLIVFGGLAILATEFEFANAALRYAREKYDAWVDWLRLQRLFVRLAVLTFTVLVIVVTVWVLNGFGILTAIVGLDIHWLESPLFR